MIVIVCEVRKYGAVKICCCKAIVGCILGVDITLLCDGKVVVHALLGHLYGFRVNNSLINCYKVDGDIALRIHNAVSLVLGSCSDNFGIRCFSVS